MSSWSNKCTCVVAKVFHKRIIIFLIFFFVPLLRKTLTLPLLYSSREGEYSWAATRVYALGIIASKIPSCAGYHSVTDNDMSVYMTKLS